MTRSKLRENTFRLLFVNEFHNEADMQEQYELYMNELSQVVNADREFIHERVFTIMPLLEELDNEIDKVAEGWKTNRMSKVDLTILRLALYEMRYDDSVPEVVAINEAVELAKMYGGDDSPAFINAILAKLVA